MKATRYLLLAPLLILAAACQPEQPEQPEQPDQPEQPPPGEAATGQAMQQPAAPEEPTGQRVAVAEISATEGNDADGAVRFTSEDGTVRVQGKITGLEPGAHGLHIHAKGDCSASDASSAGSHFTPDEDPHGSPRDLPGKHHVGDLGNIVADQNGTADVMVEDPEIRLSGPESVVGKAVIVHAARDDLETQPSGDSGARVGCGVIQMASRTGIPQEPVSGTGTGDEGAD